MTTPTKNIGADKVQTLEQKLHQLKRELAAAKAAERKQKQDQERRDDTRRKVIAGALALEHFAKNPASDFGKIVFRLLDEYTRPDDRHLFDFLPVRDAPESDDELNAA